MTDGGHPRNPPARRGLSPLVPVAVLVIAALATLWWVRQHRSGLDFTLGGTIIQAPPDRITGLLLTKEGAQYRFERGPDGWFSLSGATTDFLDQGAMATLLDGLTAATGGALLPGTEPEDRRYEFNGPGALRLTVFSGEKKQEKLALGTVNPVTGHYYASGAGRSRCFPVTAEFRNLLAGLPASVQLMTLLPRPRVDQLDGIDLWRNQQRHLLRRREGRWWLLAGAEDALWRNPEVAGYQEFYADRRREDRQGVWVQADADAMGALVYESSALVVRNIVPAAETSNMSGAWGLDHPWRQVVLQGEGINPDPTADDPDRLELAFGERLEGKFIPVRRRRTLLVADAVDIDFLERPLEDLVRVEALTWRATRAVAMEASIAGETILVGERDPGPLVRDGRDQWRTTVPALPTLVLEEDRRRRLVGEFLIDLDRTPILAALPPVGDPGVLADRQRIGIRLTYAEEEAPPVVVFEVGYLQLDRLTEEARRLVAPAANKAPVGMWFPETGQLLQIPGSLIVTLQNLELIQGEY